MAHVGEASPPFLNSLADTFEQARPFEGGDAGSITWHTQLNSLYRNHGVTEALRNVALMLPAIEALMEEQWRLPLGDCGILDFYLDLTAKDQYSGNFWVRDALRLIGNCCAEDLNLNRERVLAKLDMAMFIGRLGNRAHPLIGVAVLYNLCFDFEPAQKATAGHRLFPTLVKLLGERGELAASMSYEHATFSQVCQLMEFAIGELHPEQCPPNAVLILLRVLVEDEELNVGEKATLANAIAALLKHVRHQKFIIEQGKVAVLLKPISQTVDRVLQNAEDEEQLRAICSALSAALWDITTLSEFAVKYPPTSDFIKLLVAWVSGSETEKQFCACSVLRNYVCSDGIATQMVQRLDCFQPLTNILMTGSDIRVLEETLRLLRNLALPLDNRRLLSDFAIIDRLTKILSEIDSWTLQIATMSLLRQVIKGQPAGVFMLLGNSELAGTPFTAPLSRLLAHYHTATNLTIRMEIARTIVEMWRTSRSEAPSSDVRVRTDDLDEIVNKYGVDLAKPVLALITESGNLSLITEGWFGLNLMASTQVGSDAVWNILRADETFNVLKTTIMGGESRPEDQDNARILVDKLLGDSVADSVRRASLEPLSSGAKVGAGAAEPDNVLLKDTELLV